MTLLVIVLRSDSHDLSNRHTDYTATTHHSHPPWMVSPLPLVTPLPTWVTTYEVTEVYAYSTIWILECKISREISK